MPDEYPLTCAKPIKPVLISPRLRMTLISLIKAQLARIPSGWNWRAPLR
jgi:hypothetical protein